MIQSETPRLSLPISRAARHAAQEFAASQASTEKRQQVFLNTLAVYVVHDYLQLVEIVSDLGASESWDPVLRLCADVADLVIPGKGSLECRPIQPEQPVCVIPPEVWEERLGYVVVEISTDFRTATLLGFSPIAAPELLIDQLEPLETLLRHVQPQVQLWQWLEGLFETSWQTLETYFQPARFAFRDALPTSVVQKAKQFNFAQREAIFTVSIQRDRSVTLRVYGDSVLPPGFQMTVLDETGSLFLQAVSRTTDDYVQLQLRGQPGEVFSVRLSLGGQSFSETFKL